MFYFLHRKNKDLNNKNPVLFFNLNNTFILFKITIDFVTLWK